MQFATCLHTSLFPLDPPPFFRLVCDLKISAKELIRCKSYELAALTEKLLKKPPRESSGEPDAFEMRRAYESSRALFDMAIRSMNDARDTLKVTKKNWPRP